MDKYPKYISQEQQETFENYLLGKMGVEQESAFTKKLDESLELNKQFEEFKNLFLAVEEGALRSSLNDFHQGLEEKPRAENPKFNVLQIAASIAVVLALGIWLLNRPNVNERLYNEHFTPDPGLPTVMGSNDNYAFYEAMVDYKQGHYDIAIRKWEKLREKKPTNDTLNYFLGSAYMANDNIEKSISYLESTLEFDNSIFEDDARFYLALAQLKNDDPEKALFYLKLVSKERSAPLLKKMEK